MFAGRRRRASLFFPIAALVAASLAACGGSGGTSAAATQSSGGLSGLASAAKSETTLTWYTSIPQAIATNVATGFQQKYGVSVKTVVLTSGLLATRFSSE